MTSAAPPPSSATGLACGTAATSSPRFAPAAARHASRALCARTFTPALFTLHTRPPPALPPITTRTDCRLVCRLPLPLVRLPLRVGFGKHALRYHSATARGHVCAFCTTGSRRAHGALHTHLFERCATHAFALPLYRLRLNCTTSRFPVRRHLTRCAPPLCALRACLRAQGRCLRAACGVNGRRFAARTVAAAYLFRMLASTHRNSCATPRCYRLLDIQHMLARCHLPIRTTRLRLLRLPCRHAPCQLVASNSSLHTGFGRAYRLPLPFHRSTAPRRTAL